MMGTNNDNNNNNNSSNNEILRCVAKIAQFVEHTHKKNPIHFYPLTEKKCVCQIEQKRKQTIAASVEQCESMSKWAIKNYERSIYESAAEDDVIGLWTKGEKI